MRMRIQGNRVISKSTLYWSWRFVVFSEGMYCFLCVSFLFVWCPLDTSQRLKSSCTRAGSALKHQLEHTSPPAHGRWDVPIVTHVWRVYWRQGR